MNGKHPLRCETCKSEIRDCPLWVGHLVEDIHDIPDTHPSVELINRIGCASHRDAVVIPRWLFDALTNENIRLDKEQSHEADLIIGRIKELRK